MLISLIALSIFPICWSCIPTVTPDYPDIGEMTTLPPFETTPTTTNQNLPTTTTSASTSTTTSGTTTTPTTSTSTTTTTTTSTTSTTTTTSLMCMAGYSLQADMRCYKFVATQLPYDMAEAACVMDGAHLATIENDLQNMIVDMLNGNSQTWIGVRQFSSPNRGGCVNPPGDGCFELITNPGVGLTYSSWSPSRPFFNDALPDDCVMMASGVSTWNDTPCTQQLRYICAAPATVVG